MKKTRIVWHLFPSYFLITVLSIIAVSTLTTRAIRRFNDDQTTENLKSRAVLFEELIVNENLYLDSSEIDRLCKQLGSESATRFTISEPYRKLPFFSVVTKLVPA